MIRASLEAKEHRRPTATVMAIVGGGAVIAATTAGLELFGGFDRFKRYGQEKGTHAKTMPKVVTRARFASDVSMPTTAPPSSLSTDETFGLRLHWQPGYFWQESLDEDWFCAACAVCDPNELMGGKKNCVPQLKCEENMTLAIRRCEPSRPLEKYIARFTRLKNGVQVPFDIAADGFDGNQIQAHNTTLCLERMKAGASYPPIQLRQCDSTADRQKFFGSRSVGQAMELHPLPGDATKCLANHHHPRDNEQIYPEDCALARAATTNLWCPFSGNSETVGACVPSVITKKPTTRRPSTVKPTTATPIITAQPTSAKPVTATPIITTKPTSPITATPVTTKPTSAKPVTAEPVITTKPTSAKPTSAKPITATSIITTKPTSAKPITAKPVITAQQTSAEPVIATPIITAQPTSAKPVTATPIITTKPTSPITATPVTTKPTSAKPITATPITTKPTSAKPVTATPIITTKPTSAKPTSAKPITATSIITTKPTSAKPITAKPVITAQQTSAEPISAKPVITTKPTSAEPITDLPVITAQQTLAEPITATTEPTSAKPSAKPTSNLDLFN